MTTQATGPNGQGAGPRGQDSCTSGAAGPLLDVLQELADVLAALTPEQYVTKPVGAFASSIGGHTRHCLDHVSALLAGLQGDLLDYDHRERGTSVENNLSMALDRIAELRGELAGLPAKFQEKHLRLSVMLSANGPAVEVPTSVGRELAFVLLHTIHHNAIIASMVKTLGGDVPTCFGYAPSTLVYQSQTGCAR